MAKIFDKISADFMNAIKGVVESSAAFEKARDEEKKKRMSGEDKDKVAKLASMMAKEKKPMKEARGDITVTPVSPADAYKKHTGQMTKKTSVPKDPKTGKTLYQKVTSEEAEQVDEKLSDEAKAAIRHAAGGRGAKVKPLVKLAQMAKKPVGEEVEQVDELSKATMGSYINKAATKMGSQGVTAGLKIAADEKSSKNFKDMGKREKGIKLAVNKLTKEEIEMIEAKLAGVADGSMEGDKHMCATKVFHKEWNEGTPIKTMHAEPDAEGLIEWYDVLFDHGIERVMTEDMEVLQAESHMHSKKKMKEEVEELDELSHDTLRRYRMKAKSIADHGGDQRTKGRELAGRKSYGGRMAGVEKAKVMAKEEVEELDELSKDTMLKYLSANKKSDGRDTIKRMRGTDMAVRKYTARDTKYVRVPATEEVEIEEAYGMYKVEFPKQHAGKQVAAGSVHVKAQNTAHAHKVAAKRVGVDHAVFKSNVTKSSVLPEEVELDESVTAAAKHLIKRYGENVRKSHVRSAASDLGVDASKLAKTVRKHLGKTTLDEARGRPKKAAAKDFTVHPVTKEKLMHNNPEHMKKIELLQKNKVLEKPKTEAGQHVINQLQKAKTSMQGGSTIHFTHGESKHVSGTHAAKLIDKYQGMKPSEKEDFQKKISHSHEEMMKHV